MYSLVGQIQRFRAQTSFVALNRRLIMDLGLTYSERNSYETGNDAEVHGGYNQVYNDLYVKQKP